MSKITTSTKTTKKVATKKVTRRNPVTTYVPVSNNIYFDGTSYRVRVINQGVRTSRNFHSKRAAVQFRNKLMA